MKSKEQGKRVILSKLDFRKAYEGIREGPRRKRTGKELWGLAKKLVKQESKLNIAQNILKLNREMRAIRIAKEEENKINEFRQSKGAQKKVKFPDNDEDADEDE
jgi:hypothetical protein